MKRGSAWIVTASAMLTCWMPSLSGQGTATRVDPIAVQQRIADNPDFDVASLWRSLGITAQLDTVYRKISVEPSNGNAVFNACANTCEAKFSRANLDVDPDEEVVLQVYQRWGYSRFLVFKRVGPAPEVAQWQFLGHADHDFARHYMPEYRVEVLAGQRYLVMKAQGTSGTGVSLQYDRWYVLEGGGLEEVLSLPAQGHECVGHGSVCREFESKVLGRTETPRGEEFAVTFSVRYTGDYPLVNGRELPFVSRTQRAEYVRAKGSGGYALPAPSSEITPREIQAVFNIDTLTCWDFLAINLDDLLRTASSAQTSVKEWFLRYVEQCEASAVRSRLLDALRRKD